MWLLAFPLFAQESYMDQTFEPVQVLFDDQGIPSVSYSLGTRFNIVFVGLAHILFSLHF